MQPSLRTAVLHAYSVSRIELGPLLYRKIKGTYIKLSDKTYVCPDHRCCSVGHSSFSLLTGKALMETSAPLVR